MTLHLALHILSNHIFVFCDSAPPTIYKRHECRDAAAVEFNLHPTSKSRKDSIDLTVEERAKDLSNSSPNLTPLKSLELSAKKVYECQYKMRPLTPTEEAKEYFDRLKPEHKEEIAAKKAAKKQSEKRRTPKK